MPDSALSVSKGAIAPWAKSKSAYLTQTINALAKHYGFDKKTAWRDLPENIRKLFLYHLATGQRVDVAELLTDPALGKENRCDLHPRWHPDGGSVCIDSVHEGERQIYVVDLGAALAR